MRTCYEQRVHARRRLRGLEHLADVLLGQRGLASALPLGVLLLPPLEVLKVGEQRKVGEKKGRKDGGAAECMIRMRDGDRRGKIFGRRKETRRLCGGMGEGGAD